MAEVKICESCIHNIVNGECIWCLNVDGDESDIIDEHVKRRSALLKELDELREEVESLEKSYDKIEQKYEEEQKHAIYIQRCLEQAEKRCEEPKQGRVVTDNSKVVASLQQEVEEIKDDYEHIDDKHMKLMCKYENKKRECESLQTRLKLAEKRWQPIESALKDGGYMWLTDGKYKGIAAWDSIKMKWCFDLGALEDNLTHWMPLPNPPEGKE